jgi:DNA-binding HxlR family transcriptional regulator
LNTATLNQTSSELETTEIIKLSLDGQKRFTEFSENPPAPTTLMERLKNLPDFGARVS